MRKLKLQVQMSVDGFVGGPNGEMDWMAFNWGDDINKYVTELMAPVDLMVLGRKLAEGFIPHWAKNPTQAGAEKINATDKVVFTKTLKNCDWNNTVLATGDLATEMAKLKEQEGGDIIAFGGAGFVSSLVKAGLVEDYYLFINPAAIGSGLPIFSQLGSRQNLALVEARQFDCDIVLLHYQLKNS